MKTKKLFLSYRLALMAALAIVLVTAVGAAALEPGLTGPVTTAFPYQGRLASDGGEPVGANCDFQFALWDDPATGTQVGPLLNPAGVAVADGLFTVPLDFGAVFDGTALWLEVAVQCEGDAGYRTLTPRQALTAAPYAAYALNAQTADMLDNYHAADLALAGHDHWGQVWNGAGTGLTLSGGLTGLSGSGSVFGIYGQTSSPDASAICGTATSITGTTTGIYGQSNSPDGRGVQGQNVATSGFAYGVLGRSQSSAGTGIYGHAPSTTGTTVGVHGQSDSSDGTGVYGNVSSATGTTYGVYGESSSTSGRGVYGLASAANGTTYGVYGQSNAAYGTGVYGQGYRGVSGHGDYYGVYADGDTIGAYAEGDDIGVSGRSNSATNGIGVYGYAASTTGQPFGVVGGTYAPNGYGGYFYASGGNGTQTQGGVYGHANSDIGYGVIGENSANGTGVGAWSDTGYLIQARSGYYPSGTLRFYITNNGTVYADGGYNTFKSTGSGDGSEYRTLYGMTSAEAWTEDFGRATLVNGQATVRIDPAFAQMVNLAQDYHVYLTPICPHLVVLGVTNQQPDRFTVHGATLEGKPSDCAFDYRIVARQRGHEKERLEVVDIPEPAEGTDNHLPGAPEREWEDGR